MRDSGSFKTLGLSRDATQEEAPTDGCHRVHRFLRLVASAVVTSVRCPKPRFFNS